MEKVKKCRVWLFLIPVAIILVCCKRTPQAKSDEIVVNGKLTHSAGRLIWLSKLEGEKLLLIDSVRIGTEQSFSFRIKPLRAGFYTVSSRKNDYALLIGNKGETITLTGDATQLSSSWNAKGSKETRLYLDYWSVTRQQLKRVDSLTFIFRSSHVNPEYMAIRIRLDSIFNAIMENQRQIATRFVNKNPSSLASLLVINAKFSRVALFNEERDINYFKLIDSSLSKTYKGEKMVADFHKRVLHIIERIKNQSVSNRVLPPGDLSPSYSPNR